MGRPRKQPRRIVTFNINESLADDIDNLNLKNRSEWANRVFSEFISERQDTIKAKDEYQAAKTAFEQQVENDKAMMDNPRRVVAFLLNYLQDSDMPDYRPKGRYSMAELLLGMLNDDDGPVAREE